MKQQTKILLVLIFIFIITLAFRLYFSLNFENFSSGDAYFNLRYISHVIENKNIMSYDELSYGGRFLVQPPLFYIFMALISFNSTLMMKIIPEILFSSIVFIVYLMAKDVNNNNYTALFASLLSGFVPIFLRETLNVLSVYSLALPLLFLMLYSATKLDNKNYLWIFIICSFLLPLIHPIAIVFVFTAGLYFLLLSGGALTASKLKKEAFLFSVLIIIFLSLLVYKKAFLSYGIDIIGQNIPLNILSDKYGALSVTDLLFGIGILPLILGSLGIYFGITRDKTKAAYLYSAFLLGVLLLLSLRLITISLGIMVAGLVFCIFSGLAIYNLFDYLGKIKISLFKNSLIGILLILFLALSLIPSVNILRNVTEISNEKIEEMNEIRQLTNSNDVVLGNFDEGHLISAIAGRKNFIDTNFLLAPNPVKRLKDLEFFYTTFSEAKILELLKKNNIKVIYFSEDTKQFYFVRHLKYADGNKCFRQEGNFYVVDC